MISAQDNELLGVANRSDAMGVLAVWSVRGRDLVPHLTEQSTSVRGFQLLVEAFRLWELYEPAHPKHAGRPDDFFLLIEQAFARTVGRIDNEWQLPGARRVKARAHEQPFISLTDPDWHLLDGQKATGIWGLYRGASRRANLLAEDLTRLSSDTMVAATLRPGLGPNAQTKLFDLVGKAMDGETVALPTDQKDALVQDLYSTIRKVPLAEHLREKLINQFPLNAALAERLVVPGDLNRREFMMAASNDLQAHSDMLQDAIKCENFLAIVEAVFLWLCSSKGKTVEAAVAELPVDLEALEASRAAFRRSGRYGTETGHHRQKRFGQMLDTTNKVALAKSVLCLHQAVSDERGRAVWVWDDNGILHSDTDLPKPSDEAFQSEVAWRNDYYLLPLQSIARQLAVLHE